MGILYRKYRPGDVSLPGAPSLHTHSSKFPIEREVIVKRGSDKQCKIPNLSEYMRRAKPSVAPDAPPKQVAWVHKTETPMSLMDSSKESEPSPIRPQSNHIAGEASGPTTSTPEETGNRGSGFPQRTYQSLKDIISSRFNNSNNPAPSKSNCADTSMSPQSQLRQHGVYLANSVPQQPHEMHNLRHPHPTSLTQQQQNQQMLCGPYQPQTPQYKYHPMQGSYQGTPNHHQQQQQGYSSGIMETPVWKSYGNTVEQHLPPPNDGPIMKCQSTENMLGAGCSGIENAYQGKQQSELAASVVKSFSQESIPAGQLYSMNKFHLAGPSNAAASHQPFRQGGRSHQQIARASGLALSQSAAMNCAELGTASSSGHQYTTKQVTVHPVPPDQVEVKPPTLLPPPATNGCSSNQQNQQPPVTTATSSVNKDQLSSAPPPLAPKPHIEDDDEGGFVKRGAQSDSGRGSTVYSSAKTSEDTTPPNVGDPEWVDRVETELRNILSVPNAEGGAVGDGGHGNGAAGGSSESFSSMSPPLPPLSPQPSTDTDNYHRRSNRHRAAGGVYGNKSNATSSLWTPRNKEKSSRNNHKHSKLTSNLLSNALEIDSMLEENNSSEEDLEYTDTRAIRKQLEGLEAMYAQVLKLLGVKKSAHGLLGSSRYEASDPRVAKRRICGSVSSVPSSVSSRPIRDKRSQHRGKVRDIKGINKRFQRLESHVVTLARSVAHLSSEMRTQHIMMQEMEMMRGELAALRVQTNLQQQQQQQQQCFAPAQLNTTKQPNSTPEKVKRLTKFFGDEPPLLRLFLRRLGYEKYASLFEKERIGLLELPFMTEERLHKLGIPLGPRLRIMQQAHLAAPNTLCVL
ncbi:uncharacterized protein isoform X12 [Rhodnius prolixus]|uniref:uncharacterized protein isoform X12 n=1 Tax=Rhodnius prolixus TaxID=13249 RepID=UPI003D18F120